MRALLLFLLTIAHGFAFSQFKRDSTRNLKFFALPVVLRTPETGWAFGLSGTVTFKTSGLKDSLTRTSSVALYGIFSLREQNIQGLDASVFFPKEKYILNMSAGHLYFPDRFWGFGQNTINEGMEKYIYEQVLVTPHLKRKIRGPFFAGIIADYENVLKVLPMEKGVMDSLTFTGKMPYQLVGFGLSASYDTRNSAFWPTKGLFIQTQYIGFQKEWRSDCSFNKWITDIRYFKKIVKEHVLAIQLYNYTTVGNTPFRSLGMLGGADNLRGYYQGRYMDKSMCSALIEYRAPLFWRISAVAFGGVGDVYNRVSDLSISKVKFSFGGGIRLAVQKKDRFNIRIDYGYSDNYNQGYYITLTEAF
jgi:hypothetical protein